MSSFISRSRLHQTHGVVPHVVDVRISLFKWDLIGKKSFVFFNTVSSYGTGLGHIGC